MVGLGILEKWTAVSRRHLSCLLVNLVEVTESVVITINSVLKTREHPLQTSQELLNQSGRQKFTKLDLSNAYQQVILDKESRQFVCINTPLGLYRYTRHSFAISSGKKLWRR
ncbi:hypothetical protein HOLleu_25000 [Holothuria leucospilota]|uniref:Reverse transcriptase domain-containing protein n=1 Tax=Holothuria leucospilota TaxID=206669 RepID=A0A9Q1BSD8_HOLLE|nr:hypothetical protein HOLleu_25000 [Holothuria leucospilota]